MDHPTQNILKRLHIEIKNLTAANSHSFNEIS